MNPIILLVDVASPERENWKALLENQNFDVVIADNAESARQICLRLQPDLVPLDDHLPRARGAELSRRPKQDALNQRGRVGWGAPVLGAWPRRPPGRGVRLVVWEHGRL